MKREWRDTLTRLAWPLLSLAVLMLVKELRGLSWRDDFNLRWPALSDASMWLAVFVALVVAEELISRALGIAPVVPWGNKYSRLVMVVRVLGMTVLAPLSEELLLRGLLFEVLSDKGVQPAGVIVITAVLFAALHGQYKLAGMALVLVDGLFFGLVRHYTGSTTLTIFLHGLGNSYAAYQRLSG